MKSSVFLIVLLFVASWIAWRNISSPEAIEIPHVDIGVVSAKSNIPFELQVRNNTRSAVTIRNWQVSCHCTVLDGAPLVIESGEEQQILGTLDLSGMFKDFEGDEKEFSISVVAEIDGLNLERLPKATVKGRAQRFVKVMGDFRCSKFSPNQFSGTGQAVGSVTLVPLSPDSLHSVQLRMNSRESESFFHVHMQHESNVSKVTLSVSHVLAPGRYTGAVEVLSDDQVVAQIPVEIVVASAFEVYPRSIRAQVGETHRLRIVGGEEFTVQEVIGPESLVVSLDTEETETKEKFILIGCQESIDGAAKIVLKLKCASGYSESISVEVMGDENR